MYEYAAIAIEPSISGARRVASQIVVGPSALPIIAIDAASLAGKPSRNAPIKVMKIPACAAAPSKKLDGFAIKGPKSVIQPTPKKINNGKSCNLTPR
jgi:hypothetical protein